MMGANLLDDILIPSSREDGKRKQIAFLSFFFSFTHEPIDFLFSMNYDDETFETKKSWYKNEDEINVVYIFMCLMYSE